ncbi:MAG: type II toxin-antitoxin system RelE/ParE family toxin [Caulobacter sp.]|nr:type II toxin-antitoxin system RelE/ParE family toxin [Caulobacter sp.]
MRVHVSALARRDIIRLAAFLGAKSPVAADRALDGIEIALFSLSEMAGRGYRGPHEGERQLFVRFGRGGYVIQYEVGPAVVIVLRIFHSLEGR